MHGAHSDVASQNTPNHFRSEGEVDMPTIKYCKGTAILTHICWMPSINSKFGNPSCDSDRLSTTLCIQLAVAVALQALVCIPVRLAVTRESDEHAQ